MASAWASLAASLRLPFSARHASALHTEPIPAVLQHRVRRARASKQIWQVSSVAGRSLEAAVRAFSPANKGGRGASSSRTAVKE